MFGALQSFRNKEKKFKRLKTEKSKSGTHEKSEKDNDDSMEVDVLETHECSDDTTSKIRTSLDNNSQTGGNEANSSSEVSSAKIAKTNNFEEIKGRKDEIGLEVNRQQNQIRRLSNENKVKDVESIELDNNPEDTACDEINSIEKNIDACKNTETEDDVRTMHIS